MDHQEPSVADRELSVQDCAHSVTTDIAADALELYAATGKLEGEPCLHAVGTKMEWTCFGQDNS